VIALLAYSPGLGDVFHTSDLDAWEWLLLLVWPPLVLEVEEARKAVLGAREVGVRASRTEGWRGSRAWHG
jgi:hypothetical protein